MADKEIRLVGSFKDDITPKLARLSREIDALTKSFTKMQGKLRPIARDLGVMAMASQRLGDGLKSQRTGFETNIRAMQQYRSEMGKVSRAQRAIKPTALPAPRMPRGGGGGGAAPRVRGGGGGGAGIGEIAIGSAIGGVMTSAIVAGFQTGVQLMSKPFEMFGRAFAERVGDEMEDIKSAGGMFALDKKSKTPLFSSFEDAMTMQEGLNRSLAKSAAALPGATNDYVRAARGLTDTVMGAFGKNEEAFKKFATELGAKEGATSEEAITKVLQRFTEQTVLLGQGQTGGMPLTMLMEQLVTRESVSISAMQARYAQLRSNPLLANMLQDAEKEINASAAGTAERFKAVMKALDNALPQEVVNKMRRSVSGLIEATRSAFLDPDTGLFGLSRELDVTVPKVDQFGRYLNAQGKVVPLVSQAVQENTSLFKIMKETLANFAVPILELLGVLPQIFDPFRQIAEQFRELREVSNRFYLAFNTYTNGFEDQANSFFDAAAKTTDPQIKTKLERQANLLKEQASGRGALGALNKAMLDFGEISQKEYAKNVKELTDFDPKAIEKFGEKGMAEMAKRLLTSLVNSDMVAAIVETIGAALGAAVDTLFTAIDNMLGGIESKTGSKLIDAFGRGFSKIITPERAAQIGQIIERLMQKLFNMAGDVLINKVIPAIGRGILMGIQAAWNAGPLGKFLVVVGVLGTFQKAVLAAQAALQMMAAMRAMPGGAAASLTGGMMGPGRMKGRPQVLARRGMEKGRNLLAAATKAPAGSVAGLAQAGGATGKAINLFGGAAAKNFMAGLKAVGPKLLAFGGVLAGIIALFEGKGIAGALAAGLGAAGGSAIGAAIGTVIFPGIGTALGAAIGGWVGTMEVFTRPLTDVFSAIGDTLGPTLQGLGDTLGSILSSLWQAFSAFFPSIGGATNAMDGVTATIIAIKIVLTPIVAAFQLLEQVVNVLLVAFRGLETGIIGLRLLLAKANPFGDKQAQAQLEKEYQASLKRTNEAVSRFGKAFERHKKYYETKPAGAPTTTKPAGTPTTAKPAAAAPRMADIRGSATPGSATPAGAQTSLPQQIQQTLTNLDVAMLPVQKWFQNLPYNLGMAIGSSIASMQVAIANLKNWFFSLGPQIGQGTNKAMASIRASIASFSAWLGNPASWATLWTNIKAGFTNGLSQIASFLRGFISNFMSGLRAGQATGAKPPAAKPKYDGKGRSMPLYQAIATEMKHKPPGSSLVIANSSERVIPAYSGYGYREMDMSTLRAASAAGGYGGSSFDVSRVEVTVVDNTGNIASVADQVAEVFLTQMYKASLSVDGRAG